MGEKHKSIVLLAHGAWHPPHLYNPLKEALANRGYQLIVPALPSMGQTATGIGWDSDVAALLAVAEPLFAQGEEIVLAGHSYGGIPACVATRDNGIEERSAAGKTGGFRHVVSLSAFAIPFKGLSNLTAIPGASWLPWHTVIEKEEGFKQLFVNEQAVDLLYHDLPTQVARSYFDALVPQSYDATIEPVDFAVPDITIPKTYIICEGDRAFPTALQHHLAAELQFNKRTVSGGHSSFASIPEEVAEVLVQICELDPGST